ncbi:hypothetical protein P4S83_07590 [Aneurinibacillus thermoaerophilus]|uniref:hypothetical protein n=1 Tax=Aneurinibacillus thermoaerophilus TaxID=143495 RepID=UPI002E1E4D08|nr:hypothetical protein [Aneurinibacillus thermoaerophilus]MED0765982.1 hypothetical protein [Aneurinibacillus thermoaerophilus]
MNVYKKIGEIAADIKEVKADVKEIKQERQEFREFVEGVIHDLKINYLELQKINQRLDRMIERTEKDKSNLIELKKKYADRY